METTTKRQELLKIVYEKLEQGYEDTLEDVIELLNIRKAENEEDIKALREGREDIKKNETSSSTEHNIYLLTK